jgi:SAM-dependent methyltransferase
MNETTKAKQYWGEIEKNVFKGSGIDIGCGTDPVTPNARRFDQEHGDANVISQHVQEQFDFVYSSHCLEHMHDPRTTILDWWKLVKPGGVLFILVPDEDLYEQGVFPSQFNPDHKATFTISKSKSWCPKSINVFDLAQSLPGGQIISLQLQDRGYDRKLMAYERHPFDFTARVSFQFGSWLDRLLGFKGQIGFRRLMTTYYPVDQTNDDFNAQAQIQLIVRKAGHAK